MNIVYGIFWGITEFLAVCIFAHLLYITVRWIAEKVIEPLFWKVHDIILMVFVNAENEHWLMRQKEDEDGPA